MLRLVLDFDGTIVDDTHPYNDLITPLRFLPGAKAAIEAFKKAEHIVIVSSGRANRALREDWTLNPLWAQGVIPFDYDRWLANRSINQARYEQMVRFINANLPGLVDMIDDGMQGKVGGDVYIDDKAVNVRSGWPRLGRLYGER